MNKLFKIEPMKLAVAPPVMEKSVEGPEVPTSLLVPERPPLSTKSWPIGLDVAFV
jgi:hypothetical protein